MKESDKRLLLHSLTIAKYSYEAGNLPFGCLLADEDGNILEIGENSVVSDNDAIAHCEINLIHQLAGKYDAEFLSRCTLYASTEPCPMCTGAIFWSGIGRIVFALSKSGFHQIAGTGNPSHIFDINASDLLSFGKRKVSIEGPCLEATSIAFYKNLLAT